MTDAVCPENAPLEGRHSDGRFAPGNNLGIPFGPDNPPPRSRGRPKKDAWLRELEKLLDKDDRLAEAMAARLAKIALKGRDGDALKALAMIQDRVGGPVALRVEGLSEEELYVRLRHFLGLLKHRLPTEHHFIVAEIARETLNDDKPQWLIEAMEK